MIEAQKATVGLAKPPGGSKQRPRKKDRVQLGPDLPSLESQEIDKHLAHRARKYCRLDADDFEQRIAEWRDNALSGIERIVLDLFAAHVRGTLGTGENEWHTPVEYLEMARRVLGAIDLDPATTEAAQRVVKAAKYFTKETDGLQLRGEIIEKSTPL
jgi:hypothetical protein